MHFVFGVRLQVVEGLAFLHSSVHMVHTNICPESIFINSLGCWKIAGFEFCIPNANTQSQAVSNLWKKHVMYLVYMMLESCTCGCSNTSCFVVF